jgi:leucyl aminopeptidase
MKKAKKIIVELGLMPPNILTPIKLASMFNHKEFAHTSKELVGLKAVGGSKAWLGHTQVGKKESNFRVAIVGKGITFDSGGISIKPAHNMHEMKFDMLGAATALALAETLKDFKGIVDIYGVCAENTFHHECLRPGDVLEYADGTKVEIINTDAEGRLVLADGIIEAKKHHPDIIITIATLTGAARAALGSATALFGNDDSLVQKAIEASKEAKELLWQLPIWDIHRKDIKGIKGVADIKNQGTIAGASTAAAFLEHFVKDSLWLHFDIAGSAYKDSKPTGVMLETITKLLDRIIE